MMDKKTVFTKHIFSFSQYDYDSSINEQLEKIQKDGEIVDIKHSVINHGSSNHDQRFSALIIYKKSLEEK